MNDLLEWAEKSALRNIEFHIINISEALANEAKNTFSLLVVIISGIMAYVVNAIDKNIYTDAYNASAILLVYVIFVAAILLLKCLMILSIPAPTNEPKHIYQPDYSTNELKQVELDNLQLRIEEIVARNNKTAYWINFVRLSILLSPFIWVAAFYFCPL